MVKHGGPQGISFLFIDQTRFNFSGRIVKKNKKKKQQPHGSGANRISHSCGANRPSYGCGDN